ncbi:MAG: TlpA family protein disulfide reductase [Candidatus Zixiibacteriota bacterium]
MQKTKKTKGNPVFLGFAVITIVAAMVIFAFLMTNKKNENVDGSGATQTDSQSQQSRNQQQNEGDYPNHKAGGNLMVNTLDGETYDLTDFEGKIVILDFWATWCKPCVYEMPHFVELYNEYKDQDFMIIALSVDRSSDPVSKFIKDQNITFPVGMATPQSRERFGPISAIPTTYIIDHKNEIRVKKRGAAPKSYWETEIKKLIAERDGETI